MTALLCIRRPTRRGVFLALFGIIYILLGSSYFVPVTPALHHALHLAIAVAPLWLYGIGWCACGLMCILVGVVGGPRLEMLGFIAAICPSTLWAVIYMAAWIDNDIPRGWVSSLIFAGLAASVGVVSGMVDPIETAPPPGDEDEETENHSGGVCVDGDES
jgi:hypothetical protein